MTSRLFDVPFVLIDDARATGSVGAMLYADPVEVLTADDPASLESLIDRIATAPMDGLHAAGYFTYEAGLAIEPCLHPLIDAHPRTGPLAWFGLFKAATQLTPEETVMLLAEAPPGSLSALMPMIERDEYCVAFDRVQQHIRSGDIYQANLTFPCCVDISGNPIGLYAALRSRSAAPHGAIVATGERTILSFSPELFVTLADGVATTRPMKGTAARDTDPARDAAAIKALRTDAKQSAENMMIVDLLRNDLSRVSIPGSVTVPDLFHVETYPTVHQMVSTITAHLEQGLGAADLIRALYPCGSITGAPKISAQKIIASVEGHARDIYTGSIGTIDPAKTGAKAQFNVAIRTLTIEKGASQGILGLGSGVVADSQADAEWDECLVKSRFLGVETAVWGSSNG